MNNNRSVMQIPQSIIEDINLYKEALGRFLSGQMAADSFKAKRVPMGIYEQRTSHTYMVRIRIPGGIVFAEQLEAIADLCTRYGNGTVHLTTRQDIQLHDIRIEDTSAIIDALLEAGLMTRGGGGNTVRNCTACPRSGVCPDEVFDVRPYAVALTEYLVQFRSSFNLPRKFKIAFSGCSKDCALASVADLGFFAHIKEGKKGFSVYAAGGLGPNPAIGVQIEDFIEERKIFQTAQAIKSVFDLHGDRANRHRARLRYVLARSGPGGLRKEYQTQIQWITKEGLPGTVPNLSEVSDRIAMDLQPGQANGLPVSPFDLMPEKISGYYTIRLHIPDGNISGQDLVQIARIAQSFSPGLIRTTQDQDLLLVSVPRTSIGAVTGELQKLSFWPCDQGLPRVVSCAGAATCRLGLCLSRNLAAAIRQRLTGMQVPSELQHKTIRISGCPNSCGQHYIADIGLAGRAYRAIGGLVPCYDVFFGGRCQEGHARLGRFVATVPATQVPMMIAELFSSSLEDPEKIVRRYAIEAQDSIPGHWYCDIGTCEPFSLAGRGPGECGAGVLELIHNDIRKAKEALARAKRTAQHQVMLTAARHAARALLITFGIEANNDSEILDHFRANLVEKGWVRPTSLDVCQAIFSGKVTDQEVLYELQDLVQRIEALFLSIDSDLRFRLEPFGQTQTGPDKAKTEILDLRGVACPLNFVKAKLALEQIPLGEGLCLILDDGEPSQKVPASLAEQGHRIVSMQRSDSWVYLHVIRAR
ncbi:MAG: sulfurtransferase TusA family protein [Sedimentisphaerales bacterium]|nr:sulfurtransferase TusA family protein [Sedimentisphaerales bacterium]